jgi:hypothetical protein
MTPVTAAPYLSQSTQIPARTNLIGSDVAAADTLRKASVAETTADRVSSL